MVAADELFLQLLGIIVLVSIKSVLLDHTPLHVLGLKAVHYFSKVQYFLLDKNYLELKKLPKKQNELIMPVGNLQLEFVSS